MKILKLGDLHIGVKQDDPWIQNIQMDGIKQAIDYSKSKGISTWLQAGDWFDVRKAITHKTMNFNRKICELIEDAGITVYVIVGNHDSTFKNTIFPNACDELLSQFKNFNVINKVCTLEFDDVKIDMVPWICDENQDEIMEFIKNSNSKFCMGHFELNGFYFYKGMKSHGAEPDFLKAYKRVWSGHFHTISENRNVTFIGTPWSLTSGDENDPRGFWEFDTETEESIFVQNSTMWHRRIDYPTSINPEVYRNLSVRVFVTKVDSKLAKFETDLEEVVHELKIVNRVDSSVEIVEDTSDEVKSMVDLIEEYIGALPDLSDGDSEAIKSISKALYMEASK
ncbi:metallophosphoesterase [Acinetobacter baumannii]